MPGIAWPAGVSARTYRDAADFGIVAEVFNGSVRADHDETASTAEAVENDFVNTTGLDIQRGLLIVEAGGEPAGYVVARTHTEAGGTRIYRHMAKLLPKHRRRGIGAAMLEWAQRYLAALAIDAGPGEFQTDAEDDEAGAVAVLTADGYRPVAHHASMVRPHLDDVPEHPLPEGVEIRPAVAEHLRTIWEADAEAFRDHFGYVEPTEAEYQRFLGDPLNDLSLWKIAWHGDRVVGQVRSFVNDAANAASGLRRGYTEYISTARDWRGRGIAKALICASLHELKARGLTDAGLGVHVDNPTGAYRLYEGLGFVVTASGATYQRPVTEDDLRRAAR